MALSRSMILLAASLPLCARAAAGAPSSPPVRQMSPAENSSMIFERGRAFGLCSFAHLEAGDELAEILIAGLRFAQQQQARWLRRMLMRQPGRRRKHVAEGAHGDLRADMRAHAAANAGSVKARRAVEAVAIGQRECRHAELRGALDERLRLRAAFEKAEGACRMQLDIFTFFRKWPLSFRL